MSLNRVFSPQSGRDSAHRPRCRSILGRPCARPESDSSHSTRQPRAYAGGLWVQRRGERIAQVSLRPGDRPPIPPPHLRLTPRGPQPGPAESYTCGTHLGPHEAPDLLDPPTGPTPSGSAPGPSSARRFLRLPGGSDVRAGV